MDAGARAVLLELLDRGYDKVSWHGANLTGAVRGVDARTAAKRLPGRKSLWEQVLHAAYWKQRVLNKLVGRTPFPRKGSNWPPVPAKASDDAWRADLRMLAEVHGRLRAAVAGLDDARLTPKIVMMIQGVAFHDVYHAGQIKLLRRMVTRSKPSARAS
jgi:hypothetical protein